MAENTKITGKVATFPGEIKTITLEKDTTVSDAIKAAGFNVSGGQTIKVNGVAAEFENLGAVVLEEDGFSITITGQVKGNA